MDDYFITFGDLFLFGLVVGFAAYLGWQLAKLLALILAALAAAVVGLIWGYVEYREREQRRIKEEARRM